MDNAFIAERLNGLQQYLNSITQEPMFVRHECFKQFMDPKNYPASMQGGLLISCVINLYKILMLKLRFYSVDQAAEQVAMFYRSEPSWELVENLPDIGK